MNNYNTELLELYSNLYRKIWVYTTKLNTVQIILFPINGSQYKIFTKTNFGQITLENLCKFIDKNNPS